MQFNPDLIESPEGQARLAGEIAAALDGDTTEPVPHRDNWVGERALRDFESVVVQTRRLYDEFATVCMMAYTLATNANIRALLALGRINGLRRKSEGERQDELLQLLFKEAWGSIHDLDESPRKARLTSLWCYHSGIYARVIGDFRLAAESHDRSADIAEAVGDERSAVISRSCAEVERVNDALVHEPENAGACLARLREAGSQLNRVLGDMTDPTAILWVYANAPIHQLVAHFWVGEQYDGLADDRRLHELSGINPELANKDTPTITVAFAIHSWNMGNYDDAQTFAMGVLQEVYAGSPPSPEYLATAHLVLARIALARSEAEEAERHFRAAAAVQGSAHQVRAIAQRALSQLASA